MMIRRWLTGWFDLFISPGLIGAPLATIRRSAWFDWFAWVETVRTAQTDGNMTLRFQPERGAPVELTLQLDVRQRVIGMRLAIAETFFDNRNRPFALDALKTAIAVLAHGRDAPVSLDLLVTHLEAAMGAPVSPPTPSTEVAVALAVVTGRMTHWRAEGRRFSVSLDWEDRALVLSAAPTTANVTP